MPTFPPVNSGGLIEARRGRGAALRGGDRHEAAGGVGAVHLGQPLDLLRRAEEAGVGHAERREDPFLQEPVERLSRRHLHQAAQHVGGDAVVPAGAGVVEQRHPVEVTADLLQGAPAQRRQAGFPEAVVHRDVAGQAGGVAQQVAHRHGAPRRNRRPLTGSAVGRHPHPAQRRQIVGGRGIEIQLAGLAQHHRGHRTHRLGHRVDAEDRVVRHHPAACGVHVALRLEVRHRAVPGHHDDRSGQLPAVDELPYCRVQAVAQSRGEPAILRRADRRRESG